MTTSKGRARAVRYTPHALDEQVYMHPQSALAKAAPEFVAYTQIVRTAKRPYMTGNYREYVWSTDNSIPLPCHTCMISHKQDSYCN